MDYSFLNLWDYTIPSDNRELQLVPVGVSAPPDYTIPSDNRELQHLLCFSTYPKDYTIPSDNRELQQWKKDKILNAIIPYQVITGNYSSSQFYNASPLIIPYQVITGNYS